MNSETKSTELPITLELACTVSLECLCLCRIAESLKQGSEGVGLRHAFRRISEILGDMGIEVADFTGRTYDPGMVPDVVEIRENQGCQTGAQ